MKYQLAAAFVAIAASALGPQGISALRLRDEVLGSERFDHLRSSAVRIQSVSSKFDWLHPFSSAPDAASLGSGFVVQTDPYPLFVTNEHVVNDAKKVTLQLLILGQHKWEAQVVSVCPKFDVALLVLQDPAGFMEALQTRDIVLSALRLSERVPAMGEDVIALGFPLGQDALKLSKGNIAGNEHVDGNICIQSTAPLSPGSSGGPLLNANGSEVVGINFAKATQGENINYVIPAWRAAQLVRKHLHDQPKPPANGTWQRLQAHIPDPEATAIEASEALYELSDGCTEGVYLARIGSRSFLKKATPPVDDGSFLTAVNGQTLDKFGTGRNPDFVADRVDFHDLFFMVPDLSANVKFETCAKGRTTKHVVSMAWSNDYGRGLQYINEPNVEGEGNAYEFFGGASISQMTVNNINAIISYSGDPAPARWLHPDLVAQPRLIVNHVQSGTYAADVLSVGSAVTKLNGHNVFTLDDFRKHFVPDGHIWTLETDMGRILAMRFNESLGQQLEEASALPYLLTPSVASAAKKLGLTAKEGAKKVKDGDAEPPRTKAHLLASLAATAVEAGPLIVHRQVVGSFQGNAGDAVGRLSARAGAVFTARGAAAFGLNLRA